MSIFFFDFPEDEIITAIFDRSLTKRKGTSGVYMKCADTGRSGQANLRSM